MTFNVLSLDGGGIRGLIPAILLEQIEERTGRPIAELFDLVVGTSTGGILTVGLSLGDDKGKPRIPAKTLVELYEKRGGEIFSRSLWDRIAGVGSLLDEKYESGNLERILDELAGEAMLADAITDIVVTAYDIEKRQPYLFKSSKAREERDRNHLMKWVARATSAAPTYFEPLLLDSRKDERVRRALIDGGVYANNPALIGLAEAMKKKHTVEGILLVSLGTGITNRSIPYEAAKGWGIAGWVRPIIDVLMDGTADVTDYQLGVMFGGWGKGTNYFRFDTPLDLALDNMDAAHKANIHALRAEAHQILDRDRSDFDDMIARLKTRASAAPSSDRPAIRPGN